MVTHVLKRFKLFVPKDISVRIMNYKFIKRENAGWALT
jgi:hypothetical protein